MNIQLPKKKNGFTLIELLVVMTIIAIIATLGITAYLNAMRNTRNAKNISNLNAMQSSFEQYYSVTGSYNATCSNMAAGIQGGSLPTNAPNSPPYVSSCAAASYCVCADLEGNAEGATPLDVKGGNSTAACGAFDTDGIAPYFCIKNQQ
jgi:prepilin-type N-terminal cleavage/methylation domain-containing protein